MQVTEKYKTQERDTLGRKRNEKRAPGWQKERRERNNKRNTADEKRSKSQ